MNTRSDNTTVAFYNDHTETYVRETVEVDMQSLHTPFLKRISSGGRILDAGCGSGRDSKAFLELGYHVISMDASDKMVSATTRLTGQQAICLRHQDVIFENQFDGIWACASLLHVPRAELPDVMRRYRTALRSSGILFASFKLGRGERQKQGRHFTDMNEAGIADLIAGVEQLAIVETWQSDDLRPGRSDRWLNVLLARFAGVE
jgi:2-polyprenyl-3-methyl-5-hydroxy-6-metoxy-1,4-benzoquinol methylase